MKINLDKLSKEEGQRERMWKHFRKWCKIAKAFENLENEKNV